MTIYVDETDFKCHITDDGSRLAMDVEVFNGKCDAFIEGYRYIPRGHSWTREDGQVFAGEIITPWKPYSELDQAQRQYEREQLADMQAALEILGVTVDG